MSSLKTCDLEALAEDPLLSEHFTNYNHILRICNNNTNIPPISIKATADLLKRMKKNVSDIHGITAQHYNYAGQAGVVHLASQLNSILTEVKNGAIRELNTALGLILYKDRTEQSVLARLWLRPWTFISVTSTRKSGMPVQH